MGSTDEQPSTGGDVNSAGSTLPFSESHFADLEGSRQAAEPHAPANQQWSQQIPLEDLNVESLPFRILLYPEDWTSLRTDTGDWTTIPCKPSEGHPRGVPCVIVRQRHQDIGCEILSPLQCMLYYDPGSDFLQLLNKAPKESLSLQNLSQVDAPEATIGPCKTTALPPASYKLWMQDGLAVRIVVSLPEHSLSYVPRPDLLRLSGTKRTVSSLKTTLANSSANPSALAITYPISSVSSTSGGQIIVLRNARGNEYSLTRLRTIATTSACEVFEARHSWYNNRVVIVKKLRFADGKSPRYRGETWLHEYQIHKELKFAAIVELYGGDARLETLYLQSVDSVSLTQPRWRDARNAYFLGTPSDAERILADMASALLYLRTMSILHNDIKPSNILYSRQSGAKLIDFGLATRDDWPLCMGGSPWYIPPEFLVLRERKGPADIWALGIVMLYLLNRIPLPDSQRQAKTWLINEIKVPGNGNPATSAMEDWLRLVKGERQKLKDREDENGIAEVVKRMLDPLVMDRIAVKELAAAVRQLAK